MKIYSEKYDFPSYIGKPSKVICLCFIPRSASNFLALKMRDTGMLGYPLEYFSYPNTLRLGMRFKNRFPSGLVAKRTSPNGVFSFKWNTAFPYLPFEPDHWLFLDRADRWAQARSYVVAEKTKEWLKLRNRSYDPTDDQIRERIGILDGLRTETIKAILDKNALLLKFKDVIKNPDAAIRKIKEHCGL